MRYGDGILLFAKSREEPQNMIELLIEELRKFGLELNASKTKILTNEIQEEHFISVGDVQIGIVAEDGKHKYLGRYLSGVFENRSTIEIAHRLQCGWQKFGQHSSTLLNKSVSIKLRLKLFDSVVTPSVLFGLHVLPISKSNMDKITVCQRKMLRKIVGRTRHPGDSWETVMRIMKVKVSNAMHQFYVQPWDKCVQVKRMGNIQRLATMDHGRWEKLLMRWEPNQVQDVSQEYFAYRLPGRPRLRWTDATPIADAIPTTVNEGINSYVAPPLRVVVPFFQVNTDDGGNFIIIVHV